MKISQLPSDMMSDWRRLISKIGAMTSPSTRGAGSNENFFRRYPTTPMISMIQTSTIEWLTS